MTGIVGFAAAMTGLLVFLLSLPHPDWIALVVAVVVAVALAAWELRAATPFFDVRLLASNGALTRTYVERDLRKVYDGRLFYGKDAFEGLRTMDRLVELTRTGQDDPEFGTAIGGRDLGPRKSELRKQAAEVLNIDYKALLYKMKKLAIEN